MPDRKLHSFTYFIARRDRTRPLRVHQRRDLAAALELQAALLEQGYGPGEQIFSAPPPPQPEPCAQGEIDTSFSAAGDLILQTTRPPLDDDTYGGRKRVEPGRTDLEQRVFEQWRPYLRVCSRSQVLLEEPVRELLPRGRRDRASIEFREANGAPYRRLRAAGASRWSPAPSATRTAAFLLRVERLWPGGPGLVGAFGMDGTSTLAWAYRLARDHSDLLRQPGFVFAELEATEIPERPTDLRWARRWGIEVLLHLKP